MTSLDLALVSCSDTLGVSLIDTRARERFRDHVMDLLTQASIACRIKPLCLEHSLDERRHVLGQMLVQAPLSLGRKAEPCFRAQVFKEPVQLASSQHSEPCSTPNAEAQL